MTLTLTRTRRPRFASPAQSAALLAVAGWHLRDRGQQVG
jgi:hypothetical protein